MFSYDFLHKLEAILKPFFVFSLVNFDCNSSRNLLSSGFSDDPGFIKGPPPRGGTLLANFSAADKNFIFLSCNFNASLKFKNIFDKWENFY